MEDDIASRVDGSASRKRDRSGVHDSLMRQKATKALGASAVDQRKEEDTKSPQGRRSGTGLAGLATSLNKREAKAPSGNTPKRGTLEPSKAAEEGRRR